MKNDKFYVDIIKFTIIVLIAALVFYWVCPKYDFHSSSGEIEGYIINKVTGDLYVYSLKLGGIYKLDFNWKSLEQLKEKTMIEQKKSQEAMKEFEEQLDDIKRQPSEYEKMKLRRQENFGEDDPVAE